MKKLLLIGLLALVQTVVGQDIPPAPNPPRLVNDFTGTLSPTQLSDLERKLVSYDDTTSNQIAIVIIATTGGTDIGDFANELGQKWGIGNRKNNNGAVILVAKNDRKVFIAPGSGLERALPDYLTKQIVDNEILPNFRQNDFYRGLDAGSSALMRAAAGEYAAPEGYAKRQRRGKGGGTILLLVGLFIVFLIFMRNRGGGGGSYMSRRGTRRGVPPIWWFPTGGGFGGGSWGGGGSSGGGGFGGFGGGGFGGGGSGGSW